MKKNLYVFAILFTFPFIAASQTGQDRADGGTNGFNSYLVIYPYTNTGIVILTNRSTGKIFRSLPGIAAQISKAIPKN